VRTAALTVLAALLALPAGAARAAWYHVEVIVFAYTAPPEAEGEEWVGNVGEPDLRDATTLIEAVPSFEDEPETAGEAALEAPVPMAFMRLPPEEQRLRDVASRLRRAGGFEVLAHVAWRQPSFGDARARRIYITTEPGTGDPAAAGITPPAPGAGGDLVVYGTVRLRRGNLLHLDADLVLEGPHPPVRLTESRRVRLRELHYFDHPLFGMIAQVTPYVVPALEPGAEAQEPGAKTPAPAGEALDAD
jgi:hypothetical protein